MSYVYKITLYILVGGLAIFAGRYAFRFLNNKVGESKTGWELLLYSVLLFLTCAALFFGSLFAIAYIYVFLKDE